MRQGFFCFLFLIVVSQSWANPQTNRLFKEVHKNVKLGKKKQALYLLRNQTLELVGSDKEMAHFAQGVLGVELGEHQEALSQFSKMKTLSSLLRPYIHYYKAKSYFEQNKNRRAQKALESFFKVETRPSHLNSNAIFLQGLLDLKARKYTKALKELEGTLQTRSSPHLKDVLHELLRLSLQEKAYKKEKYCEWFTKLYEKYPSSEGAQDWSFEKNSLSYGGKKIACEVSLKSKKVRLRKYVLEGLHDLALQKVKEISDGDQDKTALLSYYYYLEGQPQKALGFLDLDKKSYRDETFRALLHYYSGNFEQAISIYESLYAQEKNSYRKAWLLYRLGTHHLEVLDYQKAGQKFKKLIQEEPKSYLRPQAEWKLAWSYYLAEKYQEAHQSFLSLLENSKKDPQRYKRVRLDKTLYWLARTLERSGPSSNAVPFYKDLAEDKSLSYYSILSSLRLQKIAQKNGMKLSQNHFMKVPWKPLSPKLLGQKLEFLESVKLASRSPSSLWIGQDHQGRSSWDVSSHYPAEPLLVEKGNHKHDEVLARYRYLSRVGFWEHAKEELHLAKTLESSKDFKERLLKGFESIDDYEGLSKTATASFYLERLDSANKKNQFYWTRSYPKAFEKEVSLASEKFGVSRNLIWGIMRAESFFDPQIVSAVGARGLLQIMPFTGSKIKSLIEGENPLEESVSLEEQREVSRDLELPDFNIQAGAKYLQRLEKRFKGHWPFVIASYNGGPHRVKLWSMKFGEAEQDEFVENIPFKETRLYVKKVLRNVFVYNLLYEKNPKDMSFMIEPIPFRHKGPLPTKEYWGALEDPS